MRGHPGTDRDANDEVQTPGFLAPVVVAQIGEPGGGQAHGAQMSETARDAEGFAQQQQEQGHGQTDEGAADIPGPGLCHGFQWIHLLG